MSHYVFAGGGTGGHLYPGLAVAEELFARRPESRITFCGTDRSWDRTVVAQHGYEYCSLLASPLIASPMGLLRALYSNGVGYRAARQWIRSERPSVVVGLGGYASVPLAVAAVRAGIPLVLLEQNVVPGRANRLLAPWATVVCTTFAQSARYLSTRPRVVHTGNPVRASIVTRAAARATQADPWRDANPMLLVLGGSQGAHSINQLIVELLPRIASHLTDWEVVHHSGARDECAVRAAYDANRIRSTVTRYIDDVAAVYCRATLAISRAGATTLAELAVCGVPAVLLPYPFAAANHQWHNARAFSRAHAAIIIEDRPGRSAAALASALIPLLREPQMRRELGLAMLKLAEPAAAGAVVSTILSISDTDHRARQSA